MPSPRPALELLARLGYAARGVVNLLIGILALIGAFGAGGGQATGSKGALQELLLHPFGSVMLGAVALGLFGFALWRCFQSLLDADNRGREAKALVIRGGQLVSAFAYVSLGIFAVSLLIGAAARSEDGQSARDWTRWLLAQPAGEVLVALCGAVVAAVGVVMLYLAWSCVFTRHLRCPGDAARWVVPLGRIGFAARGVVFMLIGGFIIFAAWQSDASEVRGLGGALIALQQQPFGRVLFGLVALGLALFGAFEFAEARYRRIDAPG
ncbi:DUF1206 domain-containing protein [Roseomonas sp. M0104]|uniref:DUF1206 domain-containing protein n=1 Tax=Teichococcus coralli TaxID=2545983 RepID=A0A845BD31_9PROT|nr:DUF1206 domain-containing protein [Pseudoroseomonas coralli]MXP63257.1 DUF1206 domain-containing protein [Pseudoroseomonas coralli]